MIHKGPSMNSILEFHEALDRAGILTAHVEPDGRLHRCGTVDKPRSKNGWYVFYADEPAAGAFGDWRTGTSEKWTSRDGAGLSAADRAMLKKRLDEAQRARREEGERRQELARDRARKIFSRCKPAASQHPYLIKKSIGPVGDIRAMKALLVLPVMDETRVLTSLQFISPDGTKRFLKDGKIQGGFFPIRGTEGPLYICEGYATGCTIHEATGGQTVLCALNAGNLEPVAKIARAAYPDRDIVICADNDHATKETLVSRKAKKQGKPSGPRWCGRSFPRVRPERTLTI
jgi:putative DNA primase/helicase